MEVEEENNTIVYSLYVLLKVSYRVLMQHSLMLDVTGAKTEGGRAR